MGDTILLRQSVSINKPLRQFALIGSEAAPEIDARISRGLNLRENMFPLERHYGLARTRLHVFSQ